MPLEIRELIIRVTVSEAPSLKGQASLTNTDKQSLKKEVMDACLKQLKAELKKRQQR